MRARRQEGVLNVPPRFSPRLVEKGDTYSIWRRNMTPSDTDYLLATTEEAHEFLMQCSEDYHPDYYTDGRWLHEFAEDGTMPVWICSHKEHADALAIQKGLKSMGGEHGTE